MSKCHLSGFSSTPPGTQASVHEHTFTDSFFEESRPFGMVPEDSTTSGVTEASVPLQDQPCSDFKTPPKKDTLGRGTASPRQPAKGNPDSSRAETIPNASQEVPSFGVLCRSANPDLPWQAPGLSVSLSPGGGRFPKGLSCPHSVLGSRSGQAWQPCLADAKMPVVTP